MAQATAKQEIQLGFFLPFELLLVFLDTTYFYTRFVREAKLFLVENELQNIQMPEKYFFACAYFHDPVSLCIAVKAMTLNSCSMD